MFYSFLVNSKEYIKSVVLSSVLALSTSQGEEQTSLSSGDSVCDDAEEQGPRIESIEYHNSIDSAHNTIASYCVQFGTADQNRNRHWIYSFKDWLMAQIFPYRFNLDFYFDTIDKMVITNTEVFEVTGI